MLSFKGKTWLWWLMASNSSGCVHEWWREDSFPPSSHPHPFPSSVLGCCGNERADLRLLSPIVPVKLLNFSTHMTVSQGRVRARQKKACAHAQPCSQELTLSHQDLHLYTGQTHSLVLREICYLFSVLTSGLSCFSLLTFRMVTEKEGPGWERTIEDTLKGVPFFFCLVCVW